MVRVPADDSQLSEIYIDETSQTKHRYLVLGGIIIPRTKSDHFETIIREARLPELPLGEMAWTKVSRTKLPAYKRVVDAFFKRHYEHLDFHSLVVDTTKINDRKFNEGSRQIGFNKEIYQLCIKFGRLYPTRLFHVYPDYRDTDQSPSDTRLILNRGMRRGGDQRDWPFRRLHFRDSATTLPLQVVDVLLGAVAFRLNGHYEKEDASPAKKELCDHILCRAGTSDVTRDTARSGKFTIWHRQLR
jgi:hypothetical protein